MVPGIQGKSNDHAPSAERSFGTDFNPVLNVRVTDAIEWLHQARQAHGNATERNFIALEACAKRGPRAGGRAEEDFASTRIDELEKPRNARERITVGS